MLDLLQKRTKDKTQRISKALASFSVALVALLSADFANAKPTYQTFDPEPASDTSPSIINDKGAIVGYFYNATSSHGFIRAANGEITIVDVDGALNTELFGINSKGTSVGDFNPDTNIWHAFTRSKDGKNKTIRTPGSSNAQAVAINASGAVAGWMIDNRGSMHSFLYSSDKQFTKFDYPSADGTRVLGMNDDGTIVGQYVVGEVTHAFIRTALGEFISVDPPGAAFSALGSILDDGTAFGYYDEDPKNLIHSAFYRTPDGTISTLKISGARSLVALGRNKKGAVIVQYIDSAFRNHGMLWQPDGTTSVFDVPGSDGTLPEAANSKGDISGTSADSKGNHGFVRIH